MTQQIQRVTNDSPDAWYEGSLPGALRMALTVASGSLLIHFERSLLINLLEPLIVDRPTFFVVAPDLNVSLNINGLDRPHVIARASVSFQNLTFAGGGAWNNTGGGVHLYGEKTDASFTTCKFYQNYSASESGAVSGNRIRSLTFTDCVFSYNCSTQSGGAVSVRTQATFTDCMFTHNMALMRGGALHVAPGHVATLTSCLFRENKSPVGPNIHSEGLLRMTEVGV